MKLKITYLSVNVTQILEVVNQADYDAYKKAKEIETDKKLWKALTEGEQEAYTKVIQELGWIGPLFKNGLGCTTESPVYKSLGTGELILPDTQGGIHKVECSLIETN